MQASKKLVEIEMKICKVTLICLAIILIAGCSKKSKNPYEGLDYEQVCEEYDKYAILQRDLLQQIRTKYSSDKNWIARFNQEQIAWIQYQDKRLRSLYSQDWDRFYRKNYGVPLFNGCKCKELIRLSKLRNDDLNVYLLGPDPSQEECPVQGAS